LDVGGLSQLAVYDLKLICIFLKDDDDDAVLGSWGQGRGGVGLEFGPLPARLMAALLAAT
jgi:hypothetical protein